MEGTQSLPVRRSLLNYCVERRKELDSPYHEVDRIFLPVQGFDTWSGEIPHAARAAKLISHNLLKPVCPRAHALQQEKPLQ